MREIDLEAAIAVLSRAWNILPCELEKRLEAGEIGLQHINKACRLEIILCARESTDALTEFLYPGTMAERKAKREEAEKQKALESIFAEKARQDKIRKRMK